MDLDDAWNEISGIDAALETTVNFAYHEQYGYLTACPTNVGTGCVCRSCCICRL